MSSIDRGPFAPHVPCTCTPHCETKHGDQAESDEQLEVYRLRARVAVLERQLSEPGYCDALREACEGVARLLPAPAGPDMHDQVEMLPEWVAEALAKLTSERDRAELHQKTATAAAHEQFDRAERLQGLVQAGCKAGDDCDECPWCMFDHSEERNLRGGGRVHAQNCPAFSAPGVVR